MSVSLIDGHIDDDVQMTDNDIIKALGCHSNDYTFCMECPFTNKEECSCELSRNALNLINRQKAEIERLQKENNQFADIGKMYSEIKAEAIKEFEERAIKKICEKVYAPTPVRSCIVEKCNQVIVETAKEMVGEG